MKAKNICMSCKFAWEDFPGGWARLLIRTEKNADGSERWEAVCPRCKSKYFEWQNYKEMAAKWKQTSL